MENLTYMHPRDQVVELMGRIYGNGLTTTSGGNLSILDAEGNISGYQILETAETPGLGAKAGEWFQQGNKGNVIGKNPADGLKVKKDGGDVDAISGSTITSRAFCEIINNAYAIFQKGGNEQ